MTLDIFTQIWISFVGLPALGCMMVGRRGWSRAGVLLGIIGQPAWWIQLAIHEQWGMSPVYVGYSLCWMLGVWNHWIRPSVTDSEGMIQYQENHDDRLSA